MNRQIELAIRNPKAPSLTKNSKTPTASNHLLRVSIPFTEGDALYAIHKAKDDYLVTHFTEPKFVLISPRLWYQFAQDVCVTSQGDPLDMKPDETTVLGLNIIIMPYYLFDKPVVIGDNDTNLGDYNYWRMITEYEAPKKK